MPIRKCEYCRSHLPKGLRIDAFHCDDNCRVNAHKKRKRDNRKQQLLREDRIPIWSFPFSESWQPLVDKMARSRVARSAVVGYRLKKKGSIFPNPKSPLRIIAGELVSLPHYLWDPFEPPSVPEVGEYQLQWCLGDGRALMAFDTEGIPTCFVPIADPQACFHNNRLTREVLSHPAWQRQVKAKLRPLRAEIARAEAAKKK